jgi:nucleoside 2-deoxyribosyltransferase
MQTYLAGPIGKMTIDEANGWRRVVSSLLISHDNNIEIKNPLRGKKEELRHTYTDADIIARDKQDIRFSDFIIVNWPEKCISNGTAMEILYAWQNEVPVIFIGEWAKNDIWIRGHVIKIFSELYEAIDYIKEMWL